MATPLIPSQYTVPHSGHYRNSRVPQPPPSPPWRTHGVPCHPYPSFLAWRMPDRPPASHHQRLSQIHHDMKPQPRPRSMAGKIPCTTAARRRVMQRHPHRGNASDATHGGGFSIDNYNSPSIKAMNQFPSINASGRFYETTPPLDNDVRRQQAPTSRTARPALQVSCPPPRQSYSASPFGQQPQLSSGYYTSTLQSAASCHPQISNLYYQQPLPQSFPPLSVPVVLAPSSGANPWQHHHYLTPSHGAAYPQSQDRYICQTCNKAFSRPSSLRIHSHSHTGEKPFKCPHAGCGKAFSVRSNMKRHEKGCHSFEVGTGRPANAG
ncbi:hypothetical protein ACCO45_002106 [Purpureocillium lilacinum]|uniref:Uncharacterized protein n=1 Tax=Purpureocillium lilacinum TaxID=33203 RepID=A0ACC4EA88_PURLI